MRNFLRQVRRNFLNRIYANDYPKLIASRAVERPNYGYITYWAADLARRLGKQRISILEFGVAGGNGLLNLEQHAERVERLTGVAIEVYGFDSGVGLPPPEDYRDLPYVWQAAHFRMDQDQLKARLKRAKLVLGPVSKTVHSFAPTFKPAPIAAISFDLDYYSSTVDAFRILDLPAEHRLPRVLCYFDDIMSSDLGHVGPAVGVPLAIAEFNNANAGNRRILSPLSHLEYTYGAPRRWHRLIYSYADFQHPDADRYIIKGDRQLSI